MLEFDLPCNPKIALVIGVGDGACKALNQLYLKNDFDTIDFLAVNTDEKALGHLEIPVTNQLLIGIDTTKGMSCGNDTDQGRRSVLESLPAIKECISKEYKLIFILATMGGGTGTGASPVIAEVCRETGSLVIAIVSSPHTLEGEMPQIQAKEGINSLCKCSDAVFLFSNDRVNSFEGSENNPVSFKASDQLFKMPVELIMDMLSIQGYVNIGFEDLESVLRGVNGLTAIISGIGQGPDRITQVLHEMYASPYLPEIALSSSRKMLLCFESGSESEITMNEIGETIDSLQDRFGFDTEIIWGNCLNPKLSDQIRISAIIA